MQRKAQKLVYQKETGHIFFRKDVNDFKSLWAIIQATIVLHVARWQYGCFADTTHHILQVSGYVTAFLLLGAICAVAGISLIFVSSIGWDTELKYWFLLVLEPELGPSHNVFEYST